MAFHGSQGWLTSEEIVRAITIVMMPKSGITENPDEYPPDETRAMFIKRRDGAERYLELKVGPEGNTRLRLIFDRDDIENLKLFLSA